MEMTEKQLRSAIVLMLESLAAQAVNRDTDLATLANALQQIARMIRAYFDELRLATANWRDLTDEPDQSRPPACD